MASKIFSYDIDLDRNSIINAKLHPISTANRLALTLSGSDEGFVVYDIDEDALYLWTGGVWKIAGKQDFLSLNDTPNAYTSAALQIVRVNTGETALEFHPLVKGDVGLGNVDNTSDINKPVSTLQQTALNLKADKAITILASGNGITGGGDLSANRTLSLDFAYLDGRFAAFGSGVLSFNARTGVVSPQAGDYNTSIVAEGTNLYYTDARVLSYGDGQWVQLDGSYVNPSWIVSLPWSKITSTPTTLVGYGITDAQPALNGLGFVKINGTTISYDNSTYLTTISGIAAAGELEGTYPSPTLLNSAVIAKVLTSLSITGGSISVADSILSAFGKVQNQINGLLGGAMFQQVWNASTNTPTLTSSVGTKGYYYVVSVAGSTNLDGITDWKVGDWAIFNGTTWDKVDNTDAVSSVNGAIGAVVVTTTGTTNRISVTGGSGLTPTVDIASNYVGQTSLTTLGTITTGVWNGSVIGTAYTSDTLATVTARGGTTASDVTFSGSSAITGRYGLGTTAPTDTNTYLINATTGHISFNNVTTPTALFSSNLRSGVGWRGTTSPESLAVVMTVENQGPYGGDLVIHMPLSNSSTTLGERYRLKGREGSITMNGNSVSIGNAEWGIGAFHTVTQAFSAGFRSLYISTYIGSTGSGTNGLMDIGTNTADNNSGTHTSRLFLSNTGNLTVTGTVTAPSFVGPLTGNATTATTLQTARTINTVSFDGSANIVVTAAAGTLTGTILASNVVTSSLTSVGTITSGVWNGSVIGSAYITEADTLQTVANRGNEINIGAYRVIITGASFTWKHPSFDVLNGSINIAQDGGGAPRLYFYVGNAASYGVALQLTQDKNAIVTGTLQVLGLAAGSAGNFVVNNGSGLLVTRTASQVLSDIGAQAGIGTTFVSQEVPSGTINGSNVTFTLAFTPLVASNSVTSLHLYLNGRLQKYTDDYTLSGTTITFVTAPATLDTLLASYFK